MLPGCVHVLKAVVQVRKQHQPLNVLQRSEFQYSKGHCTEKPYLGKWVRMRKTNSFSLVGEKQQQQKKPQLLLQKSKPQA